VVIDQNILQAHKQLFKSSCIPMSIELVLKLLGRVPLDYFEIQIPWGNNSLGSFADFNGKDFFGVNFDQKYAFPRGDNFPLEELFQTIENELKRGIYVIVSLRVPGGWHMYVIYDQLPNGEFLAVTKGQPKELIDNVRQIVIYMKGTDILTYRINPVT
jgi:hypothetical protein